MKAVVAMQHRVITNMLAEVERLKAQRESLQSASNDLQERTDRYQTYELEASMDHLSEGDRAAVLKLVDAAAILDRLYVVQQLGRDGANEFDKAHAAAASNAQLARYMKINKGCVGGAHSFVISAATSLCLICCVMCCRPYCVLDEGANFLPKPNAFSEHKPARADFYPQDMSAEEFNTWAATLPKAEQDEARGFFTVIRRNGSGGLYAVRYSEEYKDFLSPCAALLREAAALTTNSSLAAFLLARADAFSSNIYKDSDFKWMALDSPIEVTIGPYEVYEDELLGLKSTFEAFVTIRDEAETAKLSLFQGMLQELEDKLPMEEQYKAKVLFRCIHSFGVAWFVVCLFC